MACPHVVASNLWHVACPHVVASSLWPVVRHTHAVRSDRLADCWFLTCMQGGEGDGTARGSTCRVPLPKGAAAVTSAPVASAPVAPAPAASAPAASVLAGLLAEAMCQGQRWSQGQRQPEAGTVTGDDGGAAPPDVEAAPPAHTCASHPHAHSLPEPCPDGRGEDKGQQQQLLILPPNGPGAQGVAPGACSLQCDTSEVPCEPGCGGVPGSRADRREQQCKGSSSSDSSSRRCSGSSTGGGCGSSDGSCSNSSSRRCSGSGTGGSGGSREGDAEEEGGAHSHWPDLDSQVSTPCTLCLHPPRHLAHCAALTSLRLPLPLHSGPHTLT